MSLGHATVIFSLKREISKDKHGKVFELFFKGGKGWCSRDFWRKRLLFEGMPGTYPTQPDGTAPCKRARLSGE